MFIAIIPAFNEEKTIDSVVQSLFSHVDKVIVVDDGSVDNTSKKAAESGAVVLRHELNRGQGAALETGHEYARSIGADFILHFDADGQFSPEDVSPAFAHMKKNNAQILFGSRFLDSRSNTPWIKKHLIFPLAGFVHRFFGGANLSDIHNGFRILSKSSLYKIKLSQDRMAHATEIPALAKKHRLKFVEFPVKVVYREYGQSVRGGFKVLLDLIYGKFV